MVVIYKSDVNKYDCVIYVNSMRINSKKNLLIMLTCSAIMYISCKQKYSDVVIIDDDDAVEVKFEDVATNLQIVPIISDTVLGSCARIVCYDNETLILEKTGKSIYYIVDSIHVSTLSALGNGPGEYNGISFFDYSPTNKMLYVLSAIDSKVFWYHVPDMVYCGFTPLTGWVSNLSMHDDNTFFVIRSNEASDSTWIQLIDIRSGAVVKTIQQISGFAYGENDMVSYRPSNRVYSIAGNVNILGTITNKNDFEVLLKYGFGKKSFPEDLIDYDINENDKFLALLDYMRTSAGEELLCGNYYPRIEKNSISFWYHRALSSFNDINYFRIKGNNIDNLKGFKLSGVNRPIVPKGIKDDGYVYFFEGVWDSYIDVSLEPSLLAKKIIDAMNGQKDNNPVLLFFDIK